jgi:hypothetical protein
MLYTSGSRQRTNRLDEVREATIGWLAVGTVSRNANEDSVFWNRTEHAATACCSSRSIESAVAGEWMSRDERPEDEEDQDEHSPVLRLSGAGADCSLTAVRPGCDLMIGR